MTDDDKNMMFTAIFSVMVGLFIVLICPQSDRTDEIRDINKRLAFIEGYLGVKYPH
jgi:hypothetical protein